MAFRIFASVPTVQVRQWMYIVLELPLFAIISNIQ